VVKSLSFSVRFPTKLPRRRRRRRRCHLGIRSFRAFTCLASALLRCQRGGGVRLCRLVYRSLRGLRFHRFEGGGAGGALCQEYSGSCGSCGWLESGPSSIFPWCESTASLDLWSEGLGACPRPMFFHRRLHSGLGVRCLMRLSQSFFAMGSSRSRVVMASSSMTAVGVGSTAAVDGVFWRFQESQAPWSLL
jgi:hypothetical protein